jgi:3-methyladenine DNA glycosylase AlkD
VTSDWRVASADVIAALRPLGTQERAVQAKRYLKSDLEFLGVTLPDLRRVVTAAARRQPVLGREEAIAWALTLWNGTGWNQTGRNAAEPDAAGLDAAGLDAAEPDAAGLDAARLDAAEPDAAGPDAARLDGVLWEQRIAAVELLRLRVRDLTSADLVTIETLIRAGAGWALVDPLAGDIAGQIVLRDTSGWRDIDRWADDKDFWVRRSALLSLLQGIRAGRPDLTRFDRYATPMLGEKEFFIRKAIGWVLRDLSKKDPAYVIGWTERHLTEMPGVTFREAVRRLPEADAARLIQQRSDRP